MATAFGYRIREIPALLEWKEYKHEDTRVKRKSSTKIKALIVTHSLFSVFANPVRYVWFMSFACLFLCVVSLVWAVVLFALKMISVYMALISLLCLILGLVLFVMGVVLKQGNMVQRELWTIQRLQLDRARDGSAADAGPAAGPGRTG